MRTPSRVSFESILVAAAVTLFASTGSAEPISIDLSITGNNVSGAARADIRVYVNADGSPREFELRPDRRNRDNILSGRIDVGKELSDVVHVVLFGQLLSSDNEVVGFIPVSVLPNSAFNSRGFAEHEVRSQSERSNVFHASYPFRTNDDQGFVNSENVEIVLFSTKLLIEDEFVSGDQWDRLFSFFLGNMRFFARQNDKISRMLSYLRTYNQIAKNDDFVSFYIDALVRLERLNVDGTELIPSRETLEEYIFNELSFLFRENIEYSLIQAGQTLRMYRDEQDNLSCIVLSEVIFSSLINTGNIIERLREDRQLRDYALSAMQASTECIQLHYAFKSPEGTRGNIEGATQFALDTDKARGSIFQYVALFEDLEDQGLLPRDPGRRYGPGEISRVNEISKYYNQFRELIPNSSQTGG